MYENLIEIDWFTIAATLLNFVILYFILRRFLYAPVKKMLDERRAEVEHTYAEAEIKQMEAGKLRAEYGRRISAAYEEARQIIARASDEAEAEAQALLSDAKVRAENHISRAEERIEMERRQAFAGAQGELADLAAEAAERILQEKITPAENERIVSEFLQSLENVGDRPWQ